MKRLFKSILTVVKFVSLTAFNFSVIYAILNFWALLEIARPYVFAEEAKKLEVVIQKSIWENEKDQVLLIPKWEKKMIKRQYPSLELEVAPTDTRLIIPKLGTNVPIIWMHSDSLEVDAWSEFEDLVQDELRNWVVHYPWTANPWEVWNMFITGHSSYYPWDDWRYKDVFARLSKLNVWDEYFIFHDQKKFKYRIIEKKEVYPKNVSVLDQPYDKKISTLMTCTPVGTTLRRLIIISELAA